MEDAYIEPASLAAISRRYLFYPASGFDWNEIILRFVEARSRHPGLEKVIGGGLRLRPLDPGRYLFIGEYHEDTAQGVVIAE